MFGKPLKRCSTLELITGSVKAETLIARGAGKESVEAAKRYIATPPLKKGFSPDFAKEEGYRVLSQIYVKLGMKKEAVETSRQTLDALGDRHTSAPGWGSPVLMLAIETRRRCSTGF